MTLVLASHNPKKCRELNAILGEMGISVVALPENAPEPEETGATFEENARIKARCAYRFTGLPALADDSGLCVDALDGAPGVYSARYADATDAGNNAKLLQNMQDVPDGRRQARFVCALCCILPDGRELLARGECAGEILRAPQGQEGFGYDPLFYVAAQKCTFGMLPSTVKNRISHRAKAIRRLKILLQEQLGE